MTGDHAYGQGQPPIAAVLKGYVLKLQRYRGRHLCVISTWDVGIESCPDLIPNDDVHVPSAFGDQLVCTGDVLIDEVVQSAEKEEGHVRNVVKQEAE